MRWPGDGVLDGVLRELDHGLGDALRVEGCLAVGHSVEQPVALAERPRLDEDVRGQLGELDRLRGDEVGALGLGEQQQVLDDAAHPVELVRDETYRLLAVGGIVAHQLQMAAHDGDGRTQLVPRVVDELPLRGERALQPVEHPVERLGERRDVVPSLYGDTAGEILFGELRGGRTHRPYGLEDVARDRPADAGRHQERHPGHGEQHREHVLSALACSRRRVEGDDERCRRGVTERAAIVTLAQRISPASRCSVPVASGDAKIRDSATASRRRDGRRDVTGLPADAGALPGRAPGRATPRPGRRTAAQEGLEQRAGVAETPARLRVDALLHEVGELARLLGEQPVDAVVHVPQQDRSGWWPRPRRGPRPSPPAARAGSARGRRSGGAGLNRRHRGRRHRRHRSPPACLVIVVVAGGIVAHRWRGPVSSVGVGRGGGRASDDGDAGERRAASSSSTLGGRLGGLRAVGQGVAGRGDPQRDRHDGRQGGHAVGEDHDCEGAGRSASEA